MSCVTISRSLGPGHRDCLRCPALKLHRRPVRRCRTRVVFLSIHRCEGDEFPSQDNRIAVPLEAKRVTMRTPKILIEQPLPIRSPPSHTVTRDRAQTHDVPVMPPSHWPPTTCRGRLTEILGPGPQRHWRGPSTLNPCRLQLSMCQSAGTSTEPGASVPAHCPPPSGLVPPLGMLNWEREGFQGWGFRCDIDGLRPRWDCMLRRVRCTSWRAPLQTSSGPQGHVFFSRRGTRDSAFGRDDDALGFSVVG